MLTVSMEMLSSMSSLAWEAKEMVAELVIAPPLGASFRLRSQIILSRVQNVKIKRTERHRYGKKNGEPFDCRTGTRQRGCGLKGSAMYSRKSPPATLTC